STRTPSPGLQTSQGGLLQPSLRPTETPAHLYMKVRLEEDTSTKSVEALDPQQHLSGTFLGKLSAGW
ncbi:hypothetical protein DXG01_008862, partial [Tephrocybe rancida]